MKQLIPLLLFASVTATAQHVEPAIKGEYAPAPGICVSPEQRADIEAMLQQNIAQLRANGILPADGAQKKTTAVMFDWPLKQAAGFKNNSYYGISGFMDQKYIISGQLNDWNCAGRTYDGHRGVDMYLAPFMMNMMDDDQVEIVAAADGTIIAKSDGFPDKSCTWVNPTQWNAVYVQHADGSITWYGHMKTGSLTTKQIGTSVVAGEYLGLVGSSGMSTGPHLHFEVHDAGNLVVDPYGGTCNTAGSLWNNQKPYWDLTINALMTHSKPPVWNACPLPSVTNTRDTFKANDTIHFAIYLRDMIPSKTVNFKVYDAANALFKTWDYTLAGQSSSGYMIWDTVLPAQPAYGKWRYEATLEGNKVVHDFWVPDTTLSIAAFNDIDQFSIYPNPASGTLTITNHEKVERLTIRDIFGRIVLSQGPLLEGVVDVTRLPEGIYLVHTHAYGHTAIQKLLITR